MFCSLTFSMILAFQSNLETMNRNFTIRFPSWTLVRFNMCIPLFLLLFIQIFFFSKQVKWYTICSFAFFQILAISHSIIISRFQLMIRNVKIRFLIWTLVKITVCILLFLLMVLRIYFAEI